MPVVNRSGDVHDVGREAHLPYTLGMLHNDSLSPYEIQTHRETDTVHEPLALHSHPFFELAYVRSCTHTEYVIGTEQYRIGPGDILIIPPETIHGPMLSSDRPDPCVRDVIWIAPRFLDRMARMQPDVWFYENRQAHVFCTAGTGWQELGELFEQGIRERQKRLFGWEAMVIGNTMVLLSRLCRALLDSSVLVLREKRSDLLLQVMGYLEEHLGEKLTLESVADTFDVSKSTITQLFRKKLDTSFYAWLTKRRLIAAKALIARGTGLEQTGKQVGFKEHSAFYRAFRQEFGISPREYRQSLQEAGPDCPTAQKDML